MFPKQLKLNAPDNLAILWDDGHTGMISVRSLRDNCPCATCQGETILLRSYKPDPLPHLPGRYDITGAQQVGSYALQIRWGDGHSTGIYTWEKLRSLCECNQCKTDRSSLQTSSDSSK